MVQGVDAHDDMLAGWKALAGKWWPELHEVSSRSLRGEVVLDSVPDVRMRGTAYLLDAFIVVRVDEPPQR